MTKANQDFSGKTVLITGANGGIGSAFVRAFSEAGANVVATTRKSLPQIAGTVRTITMDVTDEKSVAAARQQIGAVDILVNNAGVNANRRLFAADAILNAHSEMEANYFGILNTVRTFGPDMQAQTSGVIANVLSVLSHVNLPTSASYCASKAAALSLTQAIRAELSPFGILVCGLFPSAVDTRMTAGSPVPKSAPEEVADTLLKAIREGSESAYVGSAAGVYSRWRDDPGAIERLMASRLPMEFGEDNNR
jgi:NAD(P)-dependent dehydrogenase (short-subunit alcohol dehydrogenase family)